MIRKILPGLICAVVLCGILVAGLVPFHRPRNAVTWIEKKNGLRFKGYATIWSSGAFQTLAAQDEPSCSLEIWLQPGSTSASTTILAFSTLENPLQFVVHQYREILIPKRQVQDKQARTQTIGIDGVFRQIKPVFVSITSGAQKTSMYVNGTLAKSFPEVRLGKDCTGQLVLGTSPVGNERRSCQLLGLAI